MVEIRKEGDTRGGGKREDVEKEEEGCPHDNRVA